MLYWNENVFEVSTVVLQFIDEKRKKEEKSWFIFTGRQLLTILCRPRGLRSRGKLKRGTRLTGIHYLLEKKHRDMTPMFSSLFQSQELKNTDFFLASRICPHTSGIQEGLCSSQDQSDLVCHGNNQETLLMPNRCWCFQISSPTGIPIFIRVHLFQQRIIKSQRKYKEMGSFWVLAWPYVLEIPKTVWHRELYLWHLQNSGDVHSKPSV